MAGAQKIYRLAGGRREEEEEEVVVSCLGSSARVLESHLSGAPDKLPARITGRPQRISATQKRRRRVRERVS